MLTVARNNSQIVSQIFTDQNGRQFKLTFLVAVVAGSVKGRLISVEPLANSLRLEGDVACGSTPCLPISCPEVIHDTAYISTYAPVKSPYFSVEFLINTQPTRAPSQK